MHVSLDQALGRQPRLNRVGQSLLNIGSGASAAYSLRSLTGGDPKVVNVRRDADDEEREFTSTEVGTELADWVNGKQETTLPADVASAAAAYSLRKVRSAYEGNAVQIRRTSDNVEVDVAFDANGQVSTSSAITNVTEPTTLDLGTSWVVDTGSASSTTLSPLSSLSVSGASSGFQVRVAINNPIIPSGSTVNVSTLVSSVTGSWSIFLADAGGNAVSNIATMANSVSLTSTNANAIYIYIRSNDASGAIQLSTGFGASYTVGDTTDTNLGDFISGTDAAVVTWYDQSGNDEDATQSTMSDQPLLAESGSLLTSQNGKIAIEFRRAASSDGPSLVAPSVSGLEGSLSIFTLNDKDATGSPLSLSSSTDNNRYFAANEGGTLHQVISRNTTSVTASSTAAGTERLGFGVTTGQTSTKSGVDGGALVENTSDYGNDFGTGDLDQILIGALRSAAPPSGHFDGHIQELLVYTSDQSSNRFKIESNINNHYDNANYDDTRDGFVETWFDQSGNDNDATQDTEADQPSIVENGNLIDGLKFSGDGSTQTDFLETPLVTTDLGTEFCLGFIGTIESTHSSSSRHSVFGNTKQVGSYPSGRVAISVIPSTGSYRFTNENGAETVVINTNAVGADTEAIVLANYDDASVEIRVNGSETTGTITSPDLSESTITIDIMRAKFNNSTTREENSPDGTVREVFAFASNQSSNLEALETNINNHYSTF